ncbi:MAG TPA: PrsW family glutamic-type intramembrane protease [Chitinophagaceae bacterium]|nr:PrsW family glutamic-type intramembrane protease [Chitinophagaceae bacterium]
MQYIAIAIAPGLAICLYIFYKDIYNREPKFNLFVSFFLGCLAIFPAIWFEQTFDYLNDNTEAGLAILCYGVIGFSEEFSKFLGVRLYAYNKKSFDEPLDGIVYSVMVSMGFATFENVLYVLKYAEMGMGMEVGLKRMFLSVPAHGTFGVLMGYFVGKAKFDTKNSLWLLIMGLLAAILFHGSFDYFIFLNQLKMVTEKEGDILLASGAFISFGIALLLSRKLIKNQRAISKSLFNKKDNELV